MKRILSTLCVCVLLFGLLTAGVSALTLKNNKGTDAFNNLPADYKNATFVKFADFYKEGTTNARNNKQSGFDYVFLKNDGKGDFTVTFTAATTGDYLFGVSMMGWSKSVTRKTRFRVDDSEWITLSRDYTDANQMQKDYSYGYKARLTKGAHTVTLSLTEDFDDNTVKSLYMQEFFFVDPKAPVTSAVSSAVSSVVSKIGVASRTSEPASSEESSDLSSAAPASSDDTLSEASAPQSTASATADIPEDTSSGKPSNGSDLTWVWIVCGVLVVLAAGAVILVLLRKKKA